MQPANSLPTFLRNTLSPASERQAAEYRLLTDMLGFLLYPENGGRTLFQGTDFFQTMGRYILQGNTHK
jgi:hypothetical protein